MLWNKQWTRQNPKDLAQYVTPEAANTLRLTFDRLALLEQGGPREVIKALYQESSNQRITYDHEAYNPNANRQPIRTPWEIVLAPGKGTCLDLAAFFCGLCLENKLLPLLIVLEDHALMAVSLTHDLDQWNSGARPACARFREPLTDAAVLRQLIDDGHYVAVECTGFVHSDWLRSHADNQFPETLHRTDGFIEFKNACDAGRAQLDKRNLRFALDIATAHYSWDKGPFAAAVFTPGERATVEPQSFLGTLFPAFYHPLELGMPEVGRENDEKASAPLEFPLLEPASRLPRRFTRRPEEQVFSGYLQGEGLHVMLGEPGGGKTTLLRQWRQRLDASPHYQSWYVALREVHSTDLLRYLRPAPTAPSARVFLFDGWDELEPELKDAWRQAIQELAGIKIVTCRNAPYDGQFGVAPVYIMGLIPAQQRAFLSALAAHWCKTQDSRLLKNGFGCADAAWAAGLWEQVQKHPSLQQLAGSPLLLALMAYVCPPAKRIELPQDIRSFYEAALRGLVRRKASGKREDPFVNYAKVFLQEVAARAELSGEIDSAVVTEAYVALPEVVRDGLGTEDAARSRLRETGILRFGPMGESCQFLHLTFQEWLLAEARYHDKEHAGLLPNVKSYWRDPRYEKVLSLMWGLAIPEERQAATEYLLDQGCQAAETIEGQPSAARSGLRTALHLWSDNGVNVAAEAPAVLGRLVGACCNSTRYKKSYREEAVAIYDPGTPTDVLIALVKRGLSRRETVALNANAPVEVLRTLAKDPSMDVRKTVAWNANTPVEVLRTLAKDPSMDVRKTVAGNANTPVEVLRTFAKDPDWRMRRGVAQNRSAPVELLHTLATDPDRDMREDVARNAGASVELLRMLAKDPDWAVRNAVAQNRSAPVELLRTLATDPEFGVRRGVVMNASAPVELLRMLAKDPDESVRRYSAQNRSAPVDVLRTLATDPDSAVREVVARNANTPVEVLRILFNDPDHYFVRRAIAKNANAPAEVLRTFAKDPLLAVRLEVATNANAPAEVLRTFAKDPDWSMRQGVAQNRSAPVELLHTLATDPEGNVREAVAGNANTPVEVLRTLAKDPIWVIREAVAGNANTPVEVLRTLAKDSFGNVREAVAENPRSCLEWLTRVSTTKSLFQHMRLYLKLLCGRVG